MFAQIETIEKTTELAWHAQFDTLPKCALINFELVSCLPSGKLWQERFIITWASESVRLKSDILRIFVQAMPASVLQCSTIELQAILRWVRPSRASYVTHVLQTSRINNVESVMWVKKMKQVRTFELGNHIKEQIHHKAVQSTESSIH